MANTSKVDEELALTGVLELPGEPAIVINGLPPLPQSNALVIYNRSDAPAPAPEPPLINAGFGDWIVGREVNKLFCEQLYSGKVTGFDGETGWYRVVYEDGDSEELEWNELKEILVPLDIMVPLKALAKRIVRKQQKTQPKRTKAGARGKTNGARRAAKGKGKRT